MELYIYIRIVVYISYLYHGNKNANKEFSLCSCNTIGTSKQILSHHFFITYQIITKKGKAIRMMLLLTILDRYTFIL